MLNDLRNIPAFKSAIYLVLGILAGTALYVPPFIALAALSILLIISIITFVKFPRSTVNSYLLIVLIMIFGLYRANISYNIFANNDIAGIPDTPEGSVYKLTGIINDIPDIDSNRSRFNLDATHIGANELIEVEGEVIVSIYKSRYKDDGQLPNLKAGDEIVIEGRLVTPRGKRNPGEFDYREYLRNKNIYKNFLAYGYDKVEVRSENNLSFIEDKLIFPAKYYAITNINNNISGDEGEYLKGLITGQRNDISAETKQAFINSGVMHLIAVSGLNVAYVIIIIVTLLAIFRIYFWKRTIIVITALIFYCVFTGSSPSIVRATIMGILLLAAYESERKTNFYNVAGFSAFIILIFDPKQLYDPSFILSYTAVITMVALYEKMKPFLIDKVSLKEYRYGKYYKALLILLITTIAAQIGVLPVAGSYFEKVSVISVAANLVVVPVANLSLGIGFMQIITGIFSEYLSSLIAQTNQLLLSFQLWFIKLCASADFAYFETYKFDTVNIILYFAAIAVVFTTTRSNLKKSLLLIMMISGAVLIYNAKGSNKFRTAFLDVGSGNSIVIETTDKRVILINTGTNTYSFNSGERTILPYLKRRGIDKIDLLILTDNSPGSTGGFDYLKRSMTIGKMISADKRHEGISVSEGDMIEDFKDMRIYFLSPINETSDKINIKIVYKDLDILIIPGLNKSEWKYLNAKYDDFLDSDILFTQSIIENFGNPLVIVNPLEKSGKQYRQIMDQNTDLKLETTNKEGAFIIESSGDNIEVIDWK